MWARVALNQMVQRVRGVNDRHDEDHQTHPVADGGEVTRILQRVSAGDHAAGAELLEHVYADLHQRAHQCLRSQSNDFTIQPTDLVHEAYIRLARPRDLPWQDRCHFLRAAATAMRRLVVDHARERKAQKRTAEGERMPLEEVLEDYARRSGNIEKLDLALDRLSVVDPEMAQAVDLRFFAGFSAAETAEILGMKVRTFERRWAMTRTWLYGEVK